MLKVKKPTKSKANSDPIDRVALEYLAAGNRDGLRLLAVDEVATRQVTKKRKGIKSYDARRELVGVANMAAVIAADAWDGTEGTVSKEYGKKYKSFYWHVWNKVGNVLGDHLREGGRLDKVTDLGAYDSDTRTFGGTRKGTELSAGKMAAALAEETAEETHRAFQTYIDKGNEGTADYGNQGGAKGKGVDAVGYQRGEGFTSGPPLLRQVLDKMEDQASALLVGVYNVGSLDRYCQQRPGQSSDSIRQRVAKALRSYREIKRVLVPERWQPADVIDTAVNARDILAPLPAAARRVPTFAGKPAPGLNWWQAELRAINKLPWRERGQPMRELRLARMIHAAWIDAWWNDILKEHAWSGNKFSKGV